MSQNIDNKLFGKSSCPWVLVFGTYVQHYNFHTLNNIPKSVLVPPEKQFSLASVTFSNGAHFRGIGVDSRNSPGIHLIFDGMNGPEERIQVVHLDDPLSKIAPTHCISKLWYVKVNHAKFFCLIRDCIFYHPPHGPISFFNNSTHAY